MQGVLGIPQDRRTRAQRMQDERQVRVNRRRHHVQYANDTFLAREPEPRREAGLFASRPPVIASVAKIPWGVDSGRV